MPETLNVILSTSMGESQRSISDRRNYTCKGPAGHVWGERNHQQAGEVCSSEGLRGRSRGDDHPVIHLRRAGPLADAMDGCTWALQSLCPLKRKAYIPNTCPGRNPSCPAPGLGNSPGSCPFQKVGSKKQKQKQPK